MDIGVFEYKDPLRMEKEGEWKQVDKSRWELQNKPV